MQLLAKYNGSWAGPVPVGPERKYKDGTLVNKLRAGLSKALASAAREVGIPFWDPYASASYDNAKLADGVHMNPNQAKKEFASRSGFLGGGGGGSDQGGGGTQVADASPAGPAAPVWQPAFTDEKGVKHPGKYVDPTDPAQQTVAQLAKKKEDAKKVSSMLQAMMKNKGLRADIKKMSPKQVYAAIEAAKKNQNAPDPEDLQPPSTGGDEVVALGPGKKGKILQKYLPLLKKHQPDFDFDKFYDEVDTYLTSAKDHLLPEDVRDYVFDDPHYEAFVLVRDMKDREHVTAVAESFDRLCNIISEVKRKW